MAEMRTKLLLIVVSLALLTLPLGCSQCTQQDLIDSYQQGYDAGYAKGYDAALAASSGKASTPTPIPESGTLSWDEAINHVGERATVCGKVEGTHWATGSNGKPTFLNIGKDYPASDRFVVLIWEGNRSKFSQPPEEYYLDKTISVTGLITEYNGIAEIEVTSPEQIEEC